MNPYRPSMGTLAFRSMIQPLLQARISSANHSVQDYASMRRVCVAAAASTSAAMARRWRRSSVADGGAPGRNRTDVYALIGRVRALGQ
jgi:hypothetical protein